MAKKLDLRQHLTFGFEQTFTIPEWWSEEGFISTSDTPKKREVMLAFAKELAICLKGKYFESKDIWDHMQYEVTDSTGETQFYVTMDPGSIEVKTPPCLIDKVEAMAKPMFIAAEKSGVVAYRNWWFGTRGTEGGCHVNMGGFNFETNPLKQTPELVVKYAAYIHNRPFLHHPFMGPDVGPEGNAMRMDEKSKFNEVKIKFEEYKKLYLENKALDEIETYEFFKETNLIAEKASYPSLYKFKDGLFLIEDRAQEALRNAEDFLLVSELRMQIFEKLMNQKEVESLESFPNLHTTDLTSFYLWEKFQNWAKDFNLPTEKFKRFFERQFPVLEAGQNQAKLFNLNEGRRPRVITDITKRGDVVISKTIDPHFKRFEIYTELKKENLSFTIEATGIEKISEAETKEGQLFHYIDIEYSEKEPLLKLQLKEKDSLLEERVFNIHNMSWE